MSRARDIADGKFANDLTVDTNTLKVDSSNNRVGIGTSTVDSALHIEQNASGVTETSGSTLKVHNTNSSGRSKISVHNSAETASGSIYYDTDSGMLALQGDTGAGVVIQTSGNNERLRVDTSGNVGIGRSPATTLDVDGTVTITGTASRGLKITSAANSTGQNDADAVYDAQDTEGGGTGNHIFKIGGNQKAAVLANGSVVVGRTASGLTGTGCSFTANSNSFMGADNAAPLIMNRNNDDGTLMQFRQADNVEGSISVSGSTVSYNGGHLARFSQTTDGNRIDGLFKGTVMTNLDQMAVWTHEEVLWKEGDDLPDGVSVGDVRIAAYTEDNEQLNCMAVSSVEGDANVAGVFVNWDDDDEDFTADMNVAMTGDMVIRIASGTTVARGDLLMSAGDGTAKPQGDDIVRSKTIAKVTSITKSHTYDDGSYLVPCVLMAC